MKLLKVIDKWAADTLFFPPIIVFRKTTGLGKHDTAMIFQITGLAVMVCVMLTIGQLWSILLAALFMFQILGTLTIYKRGFLKPRPHGFIRFLNGSVLLILLPLCTAAGLYAYPLPFLFYLFSDYSLLIDQLPPDRKREPKKTHKTTLAKSRS